MKLGPINTINEWTLLTHICTPYPKLLVPFFISSKQILLQCLQLLAFFIADIRLQLNEQLRCLDVRMESQVSLIQELQDFFRRRGEVELDYSKSLDKLAKSLLLRHKEQKQKWVTWMTATIFVLQLHRLLVRILYFLSLVIYSGGNNGQCSHHMHAGSSWLIKQNPCQKIMLRCPKYTQHIWWSDYKL